MSDDLAWFETNRVMISRTYPGMYVIVKNQAVVGAYPDYASAYNAGVAMFGTETFVVKEATAQQEIEQIIHMGRRMGQMQYPEIVERLRQTGAIVNVQIQVPAALAQQFQAQGKP